MEGKILQENNFKKPVYRNRFNEEVFHDYFMWLCDLIKVNTTETSYWLLATDLNKKEFYSIIPNDDNRRKDGLNLREQFRSEAGYEIYNALDSRPCSMLEMLIGLAIRINYTTEELDNVDNTAAWFWKLVENLDLVKYTDDEYYNKGSNVKAKIDNVLNIVLKRRYKRNGEGGLFPLEDPKKDQRKVEIWYQLSEYLMEKYY